MRARILVFLALLGGFIAPSPARTADKAAASKPTMIVRIRSIDDLLADAKYVASLMDQEENAKQFEGLIKSKMGPNGLLGLDINRPLGSYLTLDANANPEDSSAVVLLPVKDEKTFLGALEDFGVKAEKGEGGIYTVTHPRLPPIVPVYLRFAHKYAYITARNKDAIAPEKLLTPDKALPDDRFAIGVQLRLADIPASVKQLLISGIETQLAKEEEKKPEGQSAAQHALQTKVAKDMVAGIDSLFKEGKDLGLHLDIDRSKNQVVVEASLTGKEETALAKHIAALGKRESLFAGNLGGDVAFGGLLHVALPKDLGESFAKAAEEGITKGLAKEKDPAKRAQLAELAKAIMPTLKAGEIDFAFSAHGPTESGHYSIFTGLKVKDGAALEQAIRDAMKQLPEAQRTKIKMDAESAGEIKIHRIEMKGTIDEAGRKLVGDDPWYMAFRSDAIVGVNGKGGLEILKQALVAKPESAPIFQVKASASRIGPAVALDKNVDAKRIADKVFGANSPSNDKVEFSLDGGKSLTFRMAIDTKVMKFFMLVNKEKKAKE